MNLKTVIRSDKKEITISRDLPFVVIGEKINPTGRKKLTEAFKTGDYAQVTKLALSQVADGADVLDVNVGVPMLDEVKMLPLIAKLVSDTVDVPLCLDSAHRDALVAALSSMQGKALINSVNGEQANMERLLPVVKEYGAAVIGLCMDDTGIPNDPQVRLGIADKIINRAVQLGITVEDVVIDPLVMTVGADDHAGRNTLRTIELVVEKFGVNLCMGASNVSFGLPDRESINKSFISMAMQAGVNSAILNPTQMAATIRAADMILGRDPSGGRYIRHWRAHKPKEE
jgi:5-methyltetrahydrofolate--homocysteine methyltransferase